MTVGSLDRRIQLQRQTPTPSADGSLPPVWTTFATVWANKKDVPSAKRRGELYAADQHIDTLFTQWTVRYISGLDGTERLIDDRGVIYSVVGAPSELGRREYSVIFAERGAVKK